MATFAGLVADLGPRYYPVGITFPAKTPATSVTAAVTTGAFEAAQSAASQWQPRGLVGQVSCQSANQIGAIYGRVWVIPAAVDFGMLVAPQQHQVEVWNAHSVSKNLASIDAAGATGLSFVGPIAPPTDFAGLESRLYTLSGDTTGPAVIEASYTLQFPSEPVSLRVTGDRVATWLFPPNWAEPVRERLGWLTDVLTHRDGTEQRRRLRQLPRRGFVYRATLNHGDARRFDTLTAGWQHRQYLLPVWSDVARLTAAAAVDDLALAVDDTTGLGFAPESLAVIVPNDGVAVVVEVSGVTAQQLTLGNGLTAAVASGSRIYPARLARLADQQTVGKVTSTFRDALLDFEVQALYAETATDSAAQYRGLPVLEDAPNWREQLDSEYARNLQVLDNATGVRGYADLHDAPLRSRAHRWTKSGRPGITALRQWLQARAGRLTPIWVPSFTADLMPAAPIVQNDPDITIESVLYHRFLLESPGSRHVRIRLTDGAIYYRRIIAAASVDAATETLTLDSALDRTVQPDEVVMISYMQKSRLAADAVEISWRTPLLMEVAGVFRGLTDDD